MENIEKNSIGEIEIGIPVPDSEFRKPRKWHSFYEMNIGESIFVSVSGSRAINNIQSLLTQIKKRHNKRFRTQKRIENGIHGYRIWRIE